MPSPTVDDLVTSSGKTAVQIADAMGMSRYTVYNAVAENGVRSFSTRSRLAHALGVNPDRIPLVNGEANRTQGILATWGDVDEVPEQEWLDLIPQNDDQMLDILLADGYELLGKVPTFGPRVIISAADHGTTVSVRIADYSSNLAVERNKLPIAKGDQGHIDRLRDTADLWVDLVADAEGSVRFYDSPGSQISAVINHGTGEAIYWTEFSGHGGAVRPAFKVNEDWAGWPYLVDHYAVLC